MKTKLLTSLLVMTSFITMSYAQDTCNRTVHVTSFSDRLPQEICLPQGYIVWAILTDTADINGDGKIDFAIKLRKTNAVDGDTNLVVLYKRNVQGLFEQWLTFDNLYPIYLKNYDYDYDDENARNDTSFFMKLRRKYHYPLSTEVLLRNKTIIIKFNTDGGGGLILSFTFNHGSSSWHFTKQEAWIGSWGEIEKLLDYRTVIPIDTIEQYDIRQFNMLDYLD
jgi:hypothetical protein